MRRFSEWAKGYRPEQRSPEELYDFMAGFGAIDDALGIEKPATAIQHIRRVREALDGAGYVPDDVRERFDRTLTDLMLRTAELAAEQGSSLVAQEALSYMRPNAGLHDLQRKRLERLTRRTQEMPRRGGHHDGRTPA